MKKAWTPDGETLTWIRNTFAYDSIDGTIVDTRSDKRVGGLMQTVGYKSVWLTNRDVGLRKRVYFHRLAWFLHHGEWPTLMIDHRNRDRLDNRIENLRLADDVTNAYNQGKIRTSSGGKPSSPLLGACWDKHRGKWVSYIRIDRKQTYLGSFDSDEEAAEAYRAAAEAYRAAAAHHFGEFAPHASVDADSVETSATSSETD